jgi:3-deoxy-D-manno-octulosonate 8-phosphate phosphatase KdsC-like HAD superfamily phosphatase
VSAENLGDSMLLALQQTCEGMHTSTQMINELQKKVSSGDEYDKLPAAEDYLKQLGLGWQQAAAMGDDWPDLPMMQRAAMACAPLNAHAQALALAHFVTSRPGGSGAVRDFCDLLVVASGHYAQLLSRVGTSSAA